MGSIQIDQKMSVIEFDELENFVIRKAGINRQDARNAIGGLTVTLDSFIKKEMKVSEDKPFRELLPTTSQTLQCAIMNASGLKQTKAALVLESIVSTITEELRKSRDKGLSILEVFPIGLWLYDSEREEYTFLPRLLCFAISGVNVILLGPPLSSG
jgi:nucleoid DNA-binding protein